MRMQVANLIRKRELVIYESPLAKKREGNEGEVGVCQICLKLPRKVQKLRQTFKMFNLITDFLKIKFPGVVVAL